ncbi:hypothetical protein LN050_00530 [Comamonadaceae bacterium M7527]|nr:hypothetical protein LN050_00530 [Comamonadaceae bacterium M7527]
MTTTLQRLAIYALASNLLSGCGAIAAYPLTAASLGVWGATGKTPTDHVISQANGQDCSLMRSMANEPLCTPSTQGPVQLVDRSSTRQAATVITN